MQEPHSSETVFFNRPEGLARMLALYEAGGLWSPEEMRSIWQHQLAAAVGHDLCPGDAPAMLEPKELPELQPWLGKSFGALFEDAHPPLTLLTLIKEFAKRRLRSSEEAELQGVGAALYYAAYAAGIVRWQQRLGTAGDEDLKQGLQWAAGRDWLDENTHNLIQQALESLGHNR